MLVDDMKPEEHLAVALLMRAIEDLKLREYRNKRDITLKWLREDKRSVEFWCDVAGVRVEAFYERLADYFRSVMWSNAMIRMKLHGESILEAIA